MLLFILLNNHPLKRTVDIQNKSTTTSLIQKKNKNATVPECAHAKMWIQSVKAIRIYTTVIYKYRYLSTYGYKTYQRRMRTRAHIYLGKSVNEYENVRCRRRAYWSLRSSARELANRQNLKPLYRFNNNNDCIR